MLKIHTDIERLTIENPVVTTGIFDGVHRGHQHVIHKLKEKSDLVGGESVILTFWPHPRIILGRDLQNFKLLNTLEEKKGLIEKLGIDHLIVLPFTKDFALKSYESFVREILVGKIHTKCLLTGYNHYLGKNREGNYTKLLELSGKLGFEILNLPPVSIQENKVSSTVIRQYLTGGNLDLANEYLGYQYFFGGYVEEGNKLGRKIGFPTANIRVDDDLKLIPRDGVYAVFVRYKNHFLHGMMNIGYRPTVDNKKMSKTIEVHILDHDLNLYRQNLHIICIKKIRDEMKFDGLGDLKKQLLKDRTEVKKILTNSDEILLYHKFIINEF